MVETIEMSGINFVLNKSALEQNESLNQHDLKQIVYVPNLPKSLISSLFNFY